MLRPTPRHGLLTGLLCFGALSAALRLIAHDAPATGRAAMRARGPSGLRATPAATPAAPRATDPPRRRDTPLLATSRLSTDPNAAADVRPETRTDLDDVSTELSYHATVSLEGLLDVNSVVDHMAALAALPVCEHHDFDYEDSDAIAYAIQGLPAGLVGHMLVGLRPYEEDERVFRYVQMDVNAPSEAPEYLDGAFRDGPNVHLSISYDVDDPSTPSRFALMLQRRVDLSASREAGIDAYHGRYTQGAYYWHDISNANGPSALPFGIIDGNPVSGDAFGGIPLVVDGLDTERLTELLARLHDNIVRIQGD